ncbi:MAG: FKBP-type peptidyl-prolyl cis-trans isomerase N-terminal domain-containing protein [Bacteroidota bacterium]|nr:FKBP-type peptidyl-prolyl cis-trans isomerase N-terminal domain-containing protein [Bacteroidota bacterium]
MIKKLLFVALMFAFVFSSCSTKENKVSIEELKDLKDSASFALGYLNGMQATMDSNTPVNAEVYTRAFKQAYNKDTSEVWDEATMEAIAMEYLRQSMENVQRKYSEAARPDIERAEQFLAKNREEKDVITTTSGLQYKVLKQGKGEKPSIGNGDRVIMKYTYYELSQNNTMEKVRSNINEQNKKPGPISIDGLCQAEQEALCLMNAGSRYIIWFHPNIGYGDNPKLQKCEIEVIKVLKG